MYEKIENGDKYVECVKNAKHVFNYEIYRKHHFLSVVHV
jgi:hypothetical protein